MNYNHNEISTGVGKWFFLFILFHGLYAFTPLIRQTKIAMYVDFAWLVLFSLSMLSNHKKYELNKNMYKVLITSFVILAISLLYKLTGYSTAKIGQCLRYYEFFFTIVFGWYFVLKSSYKQKIWTLIFYSVITLVSVVYNIIVVRQFIDMGMQADEFDAIAITSNIPNYGDTSFTGYVFMCSVLYFIFFCYERNFKYRIASLFLMSVCAYYTVVCGMRGTTAILLVMNVFLILCTRFMSNFHVNQRNFITIMYIIGFLIWLNFDAIIDLIVQFAPSERIAMRFQDLQQTAHNGVTNESFTGRGVLFTSSFDSFFRSPITFFFGIGEPEVLDSYAKAGISGHSDLIDTLAKSGIIGTLLYMRCFYLFYKEMNAQYRGTLYSSLFKFVFWSVIAYGIVKTIYWENFAIATFIILPLTLFFISQKKNMQSSC